MRILIVDDNALYRESLRDMLHVRFPTLEISEATDGEDALVKVDAILPNLVFMDVSLPAESGLEATKTLKSSHPDIVVVILTNYDLPEYREAAFRNGANYFLAKDASTEELLTLVEHVLLK